jgi:hypothetical protein
LPKLINHQLFTILPRKSTGNVVYLDLIGLAS